MRHVGGLGRECEPDRLNDFPGTLLMLFDGANTGKLVLALDGN